MDRQNVKAARVQTNDKAMGAKRQNIRVKAACMFVVVLFSLFSFLVYNAYYILESEDKPQQLVVIPRAEIKSRYIRKEITRETLLEAMRLQGKSDSCTLKIFPVLRYNAATREASLRFENNEVNRHTVQITLYHDSKDKLLYISEHIRPGQGTDAVKLTHLPEPVQSTVYAETAIFDADTGVMQTRAVFVLNAVPDGKQQNEEQQWIEVTIPASVTFASRSTDKGCVYSSVYSLTNHSNHRIKVTAVCFAPLPGTYEDQIFAGMELFLKYDANFSGRIPIRTADDKFLGNGIKPRGTVKLERDKSSGTQLGFEIYGMLSESGLFWAKRMTPMAPQYMLVFCFEAE